jgi:Trk-type K+ transport system membrane component
MIRYTLAVLLLFEALFFLVPILTALCFGEREALFAFLITALICIVIAAPFVIKKPKNPELFAKTLDEVDTRYGSLLNYLSECIGVTPEMMKTLRERYLQ